MKLEGNVLRELPESLLELQHLKQLTLHDNEALKLPWELVRLTLAESGPASPVDPRTILDYYFARPEEPMREVRLLLVGRGGVGKTSLLKALRHEPPNRAEPETSGISVLPLELNCSQGPVTAHVWDLGGQEILHGTHQIFLAERCVYLLVLEGRESNLEHETDYWLRFIESFGGDSPVVLVLTKYDQHPFSVDRFRLQERCPQIVGFVETDAFSGLGIPKLTHLLEKTVDSMPDVWLLLPKKWHKIKETLKVSSPNSLEYGDYQELCHNVGLDDLGQQESLAQILHELGIALNFRKHRRLRDSSVLKPQWVIEAIYGLIRYVQRQDSNGVLELSWMVKALDPTEYPEVKHGFLLELMEKFEVAFPLENPRKWLIPELLRDEQPEAFSEFRFGATRLRFSYPDALPPGLLPRFVVRTKELSAEHPEWRWRSGVVLEWRSTSRSGAQALVRLNRMERRTEVAVVGGSEDERQSLIDLIRAHLTVLHGSIRVVEEVELEGHLGSWVRVGKLRLLEETGTYEIKEETREDYLVTVNVSETLDRVESPEARAAHRPSARPRMRLFVSYAHEDAKNIVPLSNHLAVLGQRGYIQTWQDLQLIAGEEWKHSILGELSNADIILLIYSKASRASNFIQTVQGVEAVRQAKRHCRACTLMVVPLDRVDWDPNVKLERELKLFQTWNAEPVLTFRPQRNGWLKVAQSIRRAVENRWAHNGCRAGE